uniref:Uncharacterized protein n=1 Tax=Gopherus agassizii TaxID=38772 RepID=A0A452I813_9SAUR
MQCSGIFLFIQNERLETHQHKPSQRRYLGERSFTTTPSTKHRGRSCKGTQVKPHKFLETVSLQINLKNYDPQKDKCFSGKVRPNPLKIPPLVRERRERSCCQASGSREISISRVRGCVPSHRGKNQT